MHDLKFPEVEKFLVHADELEVPEQHVDSSAYLAPFEVTPEVEEFLTEFNLLDEVEMVGGEGAQKMGKIKPSTAEDLARTENLFKSREVADKRLEGLDEKIKATILAIGKEVAPDFQFDVEVTHQEANYGKPAEYYSVNLKKGDAEADLQILYFTYEPGIGLQEGASSWDWAAWLGIAESPFYDEDFLTAYDEDQASIALEQMFNTFKESQDYWDVKAAIESLKSGYVPVYHYMVNQDERGEFSADVRDEAGNTVYEIENDEDGTVPEIEDGFMRHTTDVQGLEKYLKQMDIMPKVSKIVEGD